MRVIYLILGLGCIGLGAAGAVLPIIPTTPFLIAGTFCLGKGSKRLHTWFLGTKLYEKHLKSFVQKRTMTKKTKWSIMATVTAVMAFGFLMMGSVPAGRIILAIVWMCHIWYFTFRIKTEKERVVPAEEE